MMHGPERLEEWMRADPARRTYTAVAAALGVTEQTVRNWLGKGTVPKDGARQLIAILIGCESVRDVRAWMTVAEAVARGAGSATDEDLSRVREAARRFAAVPS